MEKKFDSMPTTEEDVTISLGPKTADTFDDNYVKEVSNLNIFSNSKADCFFIHVILTDFL